MGTSNEAAELRRRYRETDYVAEFQRYWSYFNRWFVGHTNQSKDRDALETLKTDGVIEQIVSGLLEEGTEHAHLFGRPEVSGLSELYEYLAVNRISSLFRDSWGCDFIRTRINLFGQLTGSRIPRPSASIHLEIEEWRRVYKLRRKVGVRWQNMSRGRVSIGDIMEYAGIRSVGSCFYRFGERSRSTDALLDECWHEIEQDQACANVTALRDSRVVQGITADLVELLYLFRNTAIHGGLDFLDPSQNAAARSAVGALQTLIEGILS